MAIKETQGNKVKRAIRKAGWSQGDFSRRLGVSPSYTSRVINGQRRFGVKKLLDISRMLGIPLEDLVK